MAKRLWGCYSVADHLPERAFVADLLLYDRLMIPTPAADDLERWQKKWDPERQARMLEILGPFAEQITWSAPLRDEWEKAFSTQTLAQDADSAYQWDAQDYQPAAWRRDTDVRRCACTSRLREPGRF